jgi:hypothetical protein
MAAGGAGRTVPNELLGELQELILTAVLLRQRLPGNRQPLHLPGLERLLESGTVDLLDEHLAANLALTDMPVQVRKRTLQSLVASLERSAWPTAYYLAFAPPERENGHIIRMRLALYPVPRAGRATDPISGIDVVFRRTEERWQAAGEASIFVE